MIFEPLRKIFSRLKTHSIKINEFIWFCTRLIVPLQKNMKTDVMEIKALYELYKQHPVITTDSRDCPKGSIFLALKGESFNGNKFAQQALNRVYR